MSIENITQRDTRKHAHTTHLYPSSHKMTSLSIVCINANNNINENEPSDVHIEPKMMKMFEELPVNAVI